MPVLRNVESMNYAEIEKSLNELGEKVRLIIQYTYCVGNISVDIEVASNLEPVAVHFIPQQ